MDEKIQRLLNQGGEIHLPAGEFEGPFSISQPCKVTGNHTTLWARQDPALCIKAKNVILEEMRVEITEKLSEEQERVCILSHYADTVYKRVEVLDKVKGMGKEDGFWGIPEVCKAGNFPSGQKTVFSLEVIVPAETKIESRIQDVSVTPMQLVPGRNRLTITIEPLKEGTFLYGSFFLTSQFIRRIYFTGAAKKNAPEYQENRLLFSAKEKEMEKKAQQAVAKQKEETQWSIPNSDSILLRKGQRISCMNLALEDIRLKMQYQKKLSEMEIDPYIFLLDKKNRAEQDEKLIFFGNHKSTDGGVELKEEKEQTEICLNLKKIAPEIERISVAYSIYGDHPSYNFSKVKDMAVLILSEGIEKMRFLPEDLWMETTVVMVEFYRYKGEWKINTVGAGYRDGLQKLCESFGLEVSS